LLDIGVQIRISYCPKASKPAKLQAATVKIFMEREMKMEMGKIEESGEMSCHRIGGGDWMNIHRGTLQAGRLPAPFPR
jgi:hypothetical protein